MDKTDDEWKAKLTPEQYRVLREKGTEAPFTGKYLDHSDSGMYACAACGTELFSSSSKFESSSPGLQGWPSFSDVAKTGAVNLLDDTSHGMQRTEAVCANCGSHLGHVFEDAPDQLGGKHYCINSVCLAFQKADEKK